MHNPHILLQFHKLGLPYILLRCLTHWSVVQYHILHLLLIHLLISFPHHPIKLLRIESVFDEVFELIGGLRPEFGEYLFRFFIRVIGFKCFLESHLGLKDLIVGAHYIVHLLYVIHIPLFRSAVKYLVNMVY